MLEHDVVEAFGQRFVDKVKARIGTQYIPVPIGAVRESTLENNRRLQIKNAPVVEYFQGSCDLCLFYSAASVLHHIGFEKQAKMLADLGKEKEGGTEGLAELNSFMNKNLPKWLQAKKVNREFDWTEMDDDSFAVLVLEATNGARNHAVAIFRGMIFDSNEHEAILLCKEGLDYCVGGGDVTKFRCPYNGYQYIAQGSKKKMVGTMFYKSG